MVENNKEILKEIIPSKLTNDIDNNIKLIKRKLNIYNLKWDTNYSLEDLDIVIKYNNRENKESIYYFYKELNEDFDYNNLNIYKENYYKIYQFLKEILEGCKIYESKECSELIFLFKDDKFILELDLLNKLFWLSYPLIWSKIGYDGYGYENKWMELSNLCNSILEEKFNQIDFTTGYVNKTLCQILNRDFKQRKFRTISNNNNNNNNNNKI